MRHFVVADRIPERFKGDFQIRPEVSWTPTSNEQIYLARLSNVLERLEGDETEDQGYGHSEFVLSARRDARKASADVLRRQAEEFAIGELDPEFAADNALVLKGQYLAKSASLLESLFIVSEKLETPDAETNTSRTKQRLAIDLDIQVKSGLPKPNDIPSVEKQDLFVAIDGALTTVKTVCHSLSNLPQRPVLKMLYMRRADNEARRGAILLDEYVRKLAGIGRLGLVGSHTPLAKLALEGLKKEFAAREAGRIKNDYVRRLGVASLVAVLLCLASYASVEFEFIGWEWWARRKAYMLAMAGAAVGTWLSFSIRRVQLTFDQLGVLEDDLLSPSLRIIFVIGLTSAAFLLFWTGAISIAIGDLQVNPDGFAKAGSIALLMGIFCGLSERALATVISGRSETFVGSISGAR